MAVRLMTKGSPIKNIVLFAFPLLWGIPSLPLPMCLSSRISTALARWRWPEAVAIGIREAHINPAFFALLAFSHCMAAIQRGGWAQYGADVHHDVRVVLYPGELHCGHCPVYSQDRGGVLGVSADMGDQQCDFPGHFSAEKVVVRQSLRKPLVS